MTAISDDLKQRLRIAAALAVAPFALADCSHKAPDALVDASSSASSASPDGAARMGSSDAGALDAANGADASGSMSIDPFTAERAGSSDAGTASDLDTFGHDPCPGCGMGGRLPTNHASPRNDVLIGPTEPEVPRMKKRFVACYENALFTRPDAGGRVIVRVTLDEKGEATKSEVVESQLRGVVNVCVADVGKRIRFKPGQAGRQIAIPLFFYHDHQ